jgi:predicted dehydrogenase
MSIRIGIVDFDSSHCVEFTRRINHLVIAEDQWVDGGRVVMGCPGTSILSPERLPGFTEEMKRMGIPLVDRPTDMIGKVDAVMISSVDGSVHWERARPFIEAGVICFVDKPFTCSLAEANAMVELARQRRVPIFSSSALRYAPEVVEFVVGTKGLDSPTGAILGATAYGPAPTRVRNPGLFHYGMHSIEMLFTLMGPQCEWLTCVREGGVAGSEELGAEAVTAFWSGGRIGTVHGIRSGQRAYGFVAFCEKAVRHVSVESKDYSFYRDLLRQVIHFFETRESPVPADETLRIMAFIEAARRSAEAGSAPMKLAV